MLTVAICFGLLGAVSGSFVTALVWRERQRGPKATNSKLQTPNYSILTGRSMCPNCHHRLSAIDLLPVLSWLALRGRCRYCQKPIAKSYPAIELGAAAVFAGSYLFWPTSFSQASARFLLGWWLLVLVGLLALAVYDLRWQLLPSKLIYPTAGLALTGRLLYILFFSADAAHSFGLLALSLLVASGLFWLLYQLSAGKWIGYGDVRLGIITGAVLATPQKSLLMIFLASIFGSLFALPGLISGRWNLKHKVAYGPFLILATIACVLFGDSIINWYTRFWR